MPFNAFEWAGRIKEIERQYLATNSALSFFAEHVSADPVLLRGDLRPRDLVRAANALEGTYIVRMFAEFESALRECYPTMKRRRVPSRAFHLIQGLASACKIGYDELRLTQQVREYRNAVVHEQETVTLAVPIAEARGHLCRFISRLW